jgi:hypothetical protein
MKRKKNIRFGSSRNEGDVEKMDPLEERLMLLDALLEAARAGEQGSDLILMIHEIMNPTPPLDGHG